VFLGLVMLGAAGCNRPRVYWIEHLEVEGATLERNPLLSLERADVEAQLASRLEATKRFRFPKPGEKPPDSATRVRLSLAVPFTREAMKEGRTGTFAEVGAVLELTARDGRH
jgi:hypothetical protein